jgi:hypothetical protein
MPLTEKRQYRAAGLELRTSTGSVPPSTLGLGGYQ